MNDRQTCKRMIAAGKKVGAHNAYWLCLKGRFTLQNMIRTYKDVDISTSEQGKGPLDRYGNQMKFQEPLPLEELYKRTIEQALNRRRTDPDPQNSFIFLSLRPDIFHE